MTKLDKPMSFKRLGGRACLACVSSAPSKIPYGGFSPIRLQTGFLGRSLRPAESHHRLIPWPMTQASSGPQFSRSVSGWGVTPASSDPEALGSPAGCSVPPGHRLLWPHPSLWSAPIALCFRRRVLVRPEGPQFKLHVFRSVPSSLPRRSGGLGLFKFRPRWPWPFGNGLGLTANIPPSRHTAGGHFGACDRSLNATARIVACPSPTRTFTFELSFHESPHENVEYDYAAKQSICRDRTFTGQTRSRMGCTPKLSRSLEIRRFRSRHDGT